MQFVPAFKQEDYAEDHQIRKCKFAFAARDGEDFKILVDPVLCRDFLNDTLVWKAKENSCARIYGYKYRGKIETKDTVLYLWDKDPNGLKDNIEFLNSLERELGIQETQLFTTDSKEYGIVGDKWWMTTTVHLSWYTYLLRQLTYNKEIKDWDDIPHDDWVVEKVKAKLPKLHLALKQLNVTQVSGTKGEYLDGGESTMHNYNGFNAQFAYPDYTEYGQQLKEIYNGIQSS